MKLLPALFPLLFFTALLIQQGNHRLNTVLTRSTPGVGTNIGPYAKVLIYVQLLALFLLFAVSIFAQSGPAVSGGGSYGVTGGQSREGMTTLTLTGTTYTMVPNEFWAGTLVLTGSPSAPVTLIAPLNKGQKYAVLNLSGQTVTIKGSTGTGYPLPASSGQALSVVTEGTNYYLDGNVASSGMVYPGAGFAFSTGSAWATSYGAQGTDANVLTAGTVSGTGAPLCTDANGGATTSGCATGIPSGTGFVRQSGTTTSVSPLAAADVNAVGTISNATTGNAATATTSTTATSVGNSSSTLAGVRLARAGLADTVIANAPQSYAAPTSTPQIMLDSTSGVTLTPGVAPYQAGASFPNQFNLLFTTTSPLTLSAAILATDTTIPLTSVAGIPSVACAGGRNSSSNDDVLCWTGISGNSLTGVTRGLFGVPGMPHPSGAIFDGWTVSASASTSTVPYIVQTNTGYVAYGTTSVSLGASSNTKYSGNLQVFNGGISAQGLSTLSGFSSLSGIVVPNNNTQGVPVIVYDPARLVGQTGNVSVNADCYTGSSLLPCVAGQYELSFTLDTTTTGTAGTVALAVTWSNGNGTQSCVAAASSTLSLSASGQIAGRCTMYTAGTASIQIATTVTGNSGGQYDASFTMTRIK